MPPGSLCLRNPNRQDARSASRTFSCSRGLLLVFFLAAVSLTAQARSFRRGGNVTLSALSCGSASMTGQGSDTCQVNLSGAATWAGLAVSLSSNNRAVSVPASVTVPRGSTSAAFTAAVSAFTGTQTAILTASAAGTTQSFAIQLSGSAGTPSISLQSTSVAFGSVALNTTTTQSVTLTSSGTAPLTIAEATVSGTGFSGPGLTLPITLNPGQTAALTLQFDPTTAGAAAGSVVLSTNASNQPTMTIALSGIGTQGSYAVGLSWQAPADSADPVAGYNIYREVSGGSWQRLNGSVNAGTSYSDSTVQGGTTYSYQVTSVDAQGNESAPSNTYNATIP